MGEHTMRRHINKLERPFTDEHVGGIEGSSKTNSLMSPHHL